MPEDRVAASRLNVATGISTIRSSSFPLRHRPLTRPSTFGDAGSSLDRRRSSLISDSVEDSRNSLKSSTDDLLLPKLRGAGLSTSHEPSHWHSAPLALALLPALGGLLHHNGGAIVTDITLLLLAAIFLNWSIRLPWEWYRSAQTIRLQDPNMSDDFFPNDAIIEKDEEDEEAVEDEIAENTVLSNEPSNTASTTHQRHPKLSKNIQNAESELHIHELLALLACFTSPLIGAWLLHAIRAQLSRPSEGLVSNYNLTIFLLGSEILPMSHLIKMIQSRTLHLQRVVTSDPYAQERIDPSRLQDLGKRLDELESHVADKSTAASDTASQVNTKGAAVEVRKSIQPELDALNRAIRRYEKRTTILTIQTESRLQHIESRMADAITLAAAAERGIAASRRGSAAVLLDWTCATVVLPVQATWKVTTSLFSVVESAMKVTEGWFGGKIKKEMKTAGQIGNERSRTNGGRERSRTGKKLV